jgi:hypothetical protein
MLLQSSWAGQGRPEAPTLRTLAQKSGYVFDGRVLSIRHIPPGGPYSVATVQVTFRVHRAFQGVRAGQTLVIREWSGLWESGQRYRVGERVLLFLYPRSKLGLTSPVGGAYGRFPVDGSGNIVLEPSRIAGLQLDRILRVGGLRTTSRQILINPRAFHRAYRRAIEE